MPTPAGWHSGACASEFHAAPLHLALCGAIVTSGSRHHGGRALSRPLVSAVRLPCGGRKGWRSDAVKGAREADVATQDEFGVRYLQYWFDEGSGKLFCLVEVPTRRWPRRSIAVRMALWPMRLSRSSRAR